MRLASNYEEPDYPTNEEPQLKAYRLHISTPIYSRWITVRAISESAARGSVNSRKVQVNKCVEA